MELFSKAHRLVIQRKAQGFFPWALVASASIHLMLIFSVVIPKLDANYAFGAWFTQKANGPLLHVKLASPAQDTTKIQHTEAPALAVEASHPAVPDAAVDAIALPQNAAPQVTGIGLPNAVFAGALSGNDGAAGPVGDLTGRLMETVQWHARKTSAFNYFFAVEQSLPFMPRPPVAMKCIIKDERHDCPEEVASYGDLLVNRLAFIYRIYPSFSAIQIRYDLDSGWTLQVL